MATRIQDRHARLTRIGDILTIIEDLAITGLAILVAICLLSAALFAALDLAGVGR